MDVILAAFYKDMFYCFICVAVWTLRGILPLNSGSEVGESGGVYSETSQHHLLLSIFPVGCVPPLNCWFVFVVYLQVGPLTLPQEMDFCFNMGDKTPEVITDYAKVQTLS